jgi:HAD superfamily hydrolase (TIGR01549 family)
MKEAIIFDFGFTLFYFAEASLQKYLKCFRKGLKKVIAYLNQQEILVSDDAANKFRILFKDFRSRYYTLIRQSNREFPTADLIALVLEKLISLNLIKPIRRPISQFANELATIFHSFEAKAWQPFQNAYKTLEKLKKEQFIKLAVLSNHPHHDMILSLLSKHDMARFFDVIMTSAHIGFRKPDQRIFQVTLRMLDVLKTPGSCIMCGDEYADIVGATRAGLNPILYERAYKFPTEKEIPGNDHILIKDISEILNYI